MIFMVLLSLDVIAHSNIFGWRRRTINVINYYYYYYYEILSKHTETIFLYIQCTQVSPNKRTFFSCNYKDSHVCFLPKPQLKSKGIYTVEIISEQSFITDEAKVLVQSKCWFVCYLCFQNHL